MVATNSQKGIAVLATCYYPDIIGRAVDPTPLTPAMLFIVIVAAAGFFFDSFDIVVSYAMPSFTHEFMLWPKLFGVIGSAALAGMAVASGRGGWSPRDGAARRCLPR
jgi:hypothetical protein